MNHDLTSEVITSLGSPGEYVLNNKEYEALLNLFHQFNAAFNYLPDYIKSAYFARLYQR